jgi:hypothetical protein
LNVVSIGSSTTPWHNQQLVECTQYLTALLHVHLCNMI